jgi:hypothetical protein
MNGVIGMTELLLDSTLDDRQHEQAETIRSSANALLTIINDILDFSKIEAGRLELEEVSFDLRETVEDVVELVGASAYRKGLELLLQIDPSVPSHLVGDPGRLRQVLTNLVGNAVKFTSQGTVAIGLGDRGLVPLGGEDATGSGACTLAPCRVGVDVYPSLAGYFEDVFEGVDRREGEGILERDLHDQRPAGDLGPHVVAGFRRHVEEVDRRTRRADPGEQRRLHTRAGRSAASPGDFPGAGVRVEIAVR